MASSYHTYSVLVVSSGEKFNTVISGMLPGSRYYPVIFVSDAAEGRRLHFDKQFDIVIINASRPYAQDIALACDICDKTEAGVILLTAGEDFEDIYYATVAHGVMTVQKPITRASLMQAVSLVCAMAERIRHFLEKQITVEEKIDEMRLVNKAKWLLIDKAGMTEPEAHRFIEKKSMDERTTKREVAARVIERYQ